MNKLTKTIVAILGGVNVMFSVATPILIALLILSSTALNPSNQWIIMVVAILSSTYRAIKLWIQ